MAVSLVLAVLVEQVLRQRRELIVIHHHGKALRRVLPDERVNDAERLTRSRSTKDDGGTEGIDDVDPSLVHLLLEVIDHRDIHRVFVLVLLLRLFKGLVLEIEPVITQFVVIVPCDAIQTLMYEHRSDDRSKRIDNPVGRESTHIASPHTIVNDHADNDHGKAGNHWV